MGTRADFYATDMTWLGSIAFDGYPSGIALAVLTAKTDEEFRAAVSDSLAADDRSTLPERGWPWPWETSATTDYAYMVRDGAVHGSCFGHAWFRVDPDAENFGEPEDRDADGVCPDFPDMTATQNVRHDRGSGAIFLSAP